MQGVQPFIWRCRKSHLSSGGRSCWVSKHVMKGCIICVGTMGRRPEDINSLTIQERNGVFESRMKQGYVSK